MLIQDNAPVHAYSRIYDLRRSLDKILGVKKEINVIDLYEEGHLAGLQRAIYRLMPREPLRGVSSDDPYPLTYST